jgi:hypothetical protein
VNNCHIVLDKPLIKTVKCVEIVLVFITLKRQSRMNNPDKTEGAIKNEQSSETGNIGHTRH